MKGRNVDSKKVRVFLAVVLLMALGAAMRLTACVKGYPDLRGADESIVVNQAIGLLERRSYEADTYSWPAHFLVKGSALVFTIYSYLRFGVPATEIFPLNPASFYVLARCFGALWGVLMIPLAWWLAEKAKKGAGLFAAVFFTFFPIYIEHSGYDTPDVPLAFFTMLISALAIRWLDRPTWGRLAALCVSVGVGISVKYTAAIGCLLIAVVVCIQAWKEKSWKLVFLGGAFSIAVVFLAFFLAAPNLVTNWQHTMWQLKIEARGSYGVGPFFSKLLRYAKTYLQASTGAASLALTALGGIWIWKNRRAQHIPLFLGAVFWVCLSTLGLWWVRWGTPFYVAPLLLSAVGASVAWDYVKEHWAKYRPHMRRFWKPAGAAVVVLLAVTTSVSGGCLEWMRCAAPQTVLVALDWCTQQGISYENSIYEGYTPFALDWSKELGVSLGEDGQLILPEDRQDAQYVLLSSIRYNRFYGDPVGSAPTVAVYEKIRKGMEQLAVFSEEIPVSYSSAVTLVNNIRRMVYFAQGGYAGGSEGQIIEIYRISGPAVG